MSSYLKRRVALILAVAIISAQLSACKKLNEVPVQNEAPVATVQQENTEEPTEATEPQVGGLEWLQENLENLKQSLLDGDYAKVVDQLLEMRDELKDNARYNALLYIAYSGKGDKDKANDLLNNKNLNRNEFMDAFLEFTNALKGNAGAKSAEQQLMDAMMHLAQKDKTAYNAAVRVGQNIQNENPSDPNAYVVMYIAALAGNDKAAMKDVLSQAKANGISAEVLSTATVEYIERVNVTDVTTEDAKKGISNTTSYNEAGQVMKSEQVVTEKDGTKTWYIWADEKRETLIDEIHLNKKGIIDSATHKQFGYQDVKDEDGNIIGSKYVEKGSTVSRYDKNGKVIGVTIYEDSSASYLDCEIDPKTGEVLKASLVWGGVKGNLKDEAKSCIKFEMKNGKISSIQTPIITEDGVTGINVRKMDYTNPYGLVTGLERRDLGGKITDEIKYTYNYDKHKYGELSATLQYAYGYDLNGNLVQTETINGTTYSREDHLNHTKSEADFDSGVQRSYYVNEKGEAILSASYLRTYDEKTGLYGEVDTFYGDDGKTVTKVENYIYFGDKNESLAILSGVTEYDSKGNVKSEINYKVNVNADGSMTVFDGDQKLADYVIDDLDRRVKQEYFYVDGKMTGRCDTAYMYGSVEVEKLEYVIDESGKQVWTKQTFYNYLPGDILETREYTMEDNTEKSAVITKVTAAGEVLEVQYESYSYVRDNKTGKIQETTITTTDAKGNEIKSVTKDSQGRQTRVDEYTVLDKKGRYTSTEYMYNGTSRDYYKRVEKKYDPTTKRVQSGQEYSENKDGKFQCTAELRYDYTADGRQKETRYDGFRENGNPSNATVTWTSSDNKVESVTRYDYDSGVALEKTTYQYDAQTGEKTGSTFTECDILGDKKKVEEKDSQDRVTKVTDYSQKYVEISETVYEYGEGKDPISKTQVVKDYFSENVKEEQKYTQDENGELKQSEKTVYEYDFLDNKTGEKKYEYKDGKEQLTQQKDYVYDDITGDLKGYTQTEYDAEGNVTGTKNYDPDGNELPEGVTLNLLEEEQPVVEEEVIEENQFAEEEPTEPEQPTEEVKPTEPEQPTEEVKPTEPEQPTEEVKPTEPEQSAPAAPAESETKTDDKAPAESAPSTPAPAGDSGSASTPAAPAASAPASSAPAASASSTSAAPAASASGASAPASAPAASSSASSAPAASAPSSAPAAEG